MIVSLILIDKRLVSTENFSINCNYLAYKFICTKTFKIGNYYFTLPLGRSVNNTGNRGCN